MSVSVIERRVSVGELSPPRELEGRFGILFDLDDVLFECYPDYIGPLNGRFRTELTLEEVALYGYVQDVPVWQSFGGDFFAFMRELRSNPEFVGGHSVKEGALEGIYDLARIGEVFGYVTTRPQSVYQVTVNQLEHYGFPRAPVICMPDEFLLAPEELFWKRKQIERLEPDLVVEDNVRFVDTLSPRIRAIIIKGMHNRHLVPSRRGVIEVSHWAAVLEVAASLKEEVLLSKRKTFPFSRN